MLTQNENKYQPIVVKENSFSNYIISSKDKADKIVHWISRIERGKFEKYSTLFKNYNGFSLRSVDDVVLRELGGKFM